MRRRLVALGGLVAFFIIFVLLVKSCGGDDEPTTDERPRPVRPATTGAGRSRPSEFIDEADGDLRPRQPAGRCADRPRRTNATQDEYLITREELAALQPLQLAEDSTADHQVPERPLRQVVAALQAKAQARDRATSQPTTPPRSRSTPPRSRRARRGEQTGFSDCGQFLDAGRGAQAAAGRQDAAATTDTGGGVAPTDTEP